MQMSKKNILIIGTYDDWDRIPMETSYEAHFMAPDDDPFAIPLATREKIEAIAFRGHSFLGCAKMDAFPNLGMIANLGVGYDTIDVAHAKIRSIKVSNTPDVLTDDVADLAVGMMIAKMRNITGAHEWVSSGNWGRKGDFGLQRKVTGKRVGIAGLGRIGEAVARRLIAFNMEIHYYARSPKNHVSWHYHDDIADLAGAVDILFVTLTGGPATKGIVTRQAIEALGPNGLFINVSRGTTVDEGALLDALESGALGGAALDVYLNEPYIDPRFMQLNNVLLQPHQSSGTFETRQTMGKLQRANLAAYFAGEPLPTQVV